MTDKEASMSRAEPERIEFPKTDQEKIVVTTSVYSGRARVDVRVWFKDEKGKWRATKKGVPIELDIVEQVAQAMVELADNERQRMSSEVEEAAPKKKEKKTEE
jgi:hypothetical protein